MKHVTFYHSVVCPRCHAAGFSLASLRQEFPDLQVEKVEYLTNLGRAARAGVRSIPTMVLGERHLSGFYLTRKRIQEFLESL